MSKNTQNPVDVRERLIYNGNVEKMTKFVIIMIIIKYREQYRIRKGATEMKDSIDIGIIVEHLIKDEKFIDFFQDMLSEQSKNIEKVILSDFKKKADERENEVKTLKELLEKNEKEKSELENVIETQKKQLVELEDEKKKNDEKYGHSIRAFGIYNTLRHDSKNSMTNIFGSGSFSEFHAAAIDWQNIESVWSIAKNKVIEQDTDTEKVIKVFSFMFNIYNEIYNKEYSLIIPKEGEMYNSDYHLILGTKTDGRIKDVKLPGYKKVNTGVVIQRAIVEVQG